MATNPFDLDENDLDLQAELAEQYPDVAVFQFHHDPTSLDDERPLPLLTPAEGERFQHLFVAVAGRLMAQRGLHLVSRDPALPVDEDTLPRPRIEILAGDIGALFELAGQLGIDISHF